MRGGGHITQPSAAVDQPHPNAGVRARRAEAAAGRAYALAWRERMKPYFDRLYGVELPEGEARFPYPGHRTVAQVWADEAREAA